MSAFALLAAAWMALALVVAPVAGRVLAKRSAELDGNDPTEKRTEHAHRTG
ncbi:MAG TPA: hypothetical protein VIQ30_24390 [Pseudonocardia sp.]